MNFDISTYSASQVYHLMTQTVIPRPIAWILTKNKDDAVDPFNLAPFSYFNAVCSQPPLLMISLGKKPSGEVKDTSANLIKGSKCVVHIASESQADLVTKTAATLGYGQSELNDLNLTLETQDTFDLPKIKECPIAFNCEVYDVTSIGDAQQTLIFLKIVSIDANDDAVEQDAKGRTTINPAKIKPLTRLGANQYSGISSVLDIKRPK